MCGRYALALRPSQIRRMLEDAEMPVWESPDDEGDGAPRGSYNFAPGYHGIVYRANTPDWGAGPRRQHKDASEESDVQAEAAEVSNAASNADSEPVRYKMQTMKWGLVPFWTKRNPDYASMLKTINCRDDSLASSGGMWNTMKARKRCIIVAEGFFEWLTKGPKEKVPHYIKRKDGQLMLFAGLWDCVQFEDKEQKLYTYTIITTDSNKQLKFLHDRMPVILEPGSEKLRTWLDPNRHEWSRELQSILKPWDGELDVYPVSKDVGKVGNNSPSFIIPIASKENKSNIANFFANSPPKKDSSRQPAMSPAKDVTVKEELSLSAEGQRNISGSLRSMAGTKREASDGIVEGEKPTKKAHTLESEATSPVKAASKKSISSSKNTARSPVKMKPKDGSQKITKFFSK